MNTELNHNLKFVKMKKYTVYFLALVVVGIVACGQSEDDKRKEEENRKEEVDAMFEELETSTDTLKQGDDTAPFPAGDTNSAE